MHSLLTDQIENICDVLAFYAERLHFMRLQDTASKPLTRAYLSPSDAGLAYGALQPWYKVAEPLYAELEGLMQQVNDAEVATVLSSPHVQNMLPCLYQIRAAYEFDKEVAEAKKLLESPDAASVLADIIKHQSYWILTDEAREALQGAKHIAIIGSGPLPLTALGFVGELDCDVTCFEQDELAFDLGNQVIALSSHKDRIHTRREQIGDGPSAETFDAVMSAVLVGVNIDNTEHADKPDIVRGFFDMLRTDGPVIIRDPFRLGKLFYPSAHSDIMSDVHTKRFDPEVGPTIPYRSSFLVLRKAT